MAITKIQAGALPADVITTAAIDDASITHAKLHTTMDLSSKTVTLPTLNQSLTLDGPDAGVAKLRLQAEEVHGDIEGINIGNNYGGLAFKTNNNGTVAERVRIDNAGNVGIGTTSPANKLHVKAGASGATTFDARYNLTLEDDGENYIGIYSPSNSFGGVRFVNAASSIRGYIDYYHGTQGDKMQIYAQNQIEFNFPGSGSGPVFKSDGNVGIKIGSPTHSLDILDDGGEQLRILAWDQSTSARANIDFWYLDAGGSPYQNSQISTLAAGNAGNGNLVFSTRPTSGALTERLRIDSSGSILHKNLASDASQFIFNSGWSRDARNVRVWGEEDGGVWYSFIGTNVSKDGDGTYTKPSDNAGENWGNVAGMLLSGANTSTQNAIDLVVDLPNAHGNTLNTSMTRNQLFAKSALSITAVGYVTKPMQPVFHAKQSGDQTVTQDAKLAFNGTDINVGGHFSTSSDRFTAPIAGKYFLSFNASINNMSSTGQYLAVYFKKNGSGTGHRFRTRAENVGGEWTGIQGTAILHLASGDYIEVNAYNHTGSFILVGNEHHFSGYLIA